MGPVLDNPLWHSLRTRHVHLAIAQGLAARYPSEVSPGVGVAEASSEAEADMLKIVDVGEKVVILNVIPPLGERWVLDHDLDIHQYVWPNDVDADRDDEVQRLGEDDIPAMLELTGLVYPAYFRPGTARLGPYFGIRTDGVLCAMAGIRMSLPGYQELSAICTHPDFRGRGYASKLTRHLIHTIRSNGDTPFLHTESDNVAAQSLYRKLGFELRAVLPFKVLIRR